MKTRNGFVSNSSSSSFVMIGSKIDNDEIKSKLGWVKSETAAFDDGWEFIQRKMYELNLDYFYEEDLIGYVIANGDDSDFGGPEISISDVVEKSKFISEKFNIPIENIKIISGIRSH